MDYWKCDLCEWWYEVQLLDADSNSNYTNIMLREYSLLDLIPTSPHTRNTLPYLPLPTLPNHTLNNHTRCLSNPAFSIFLNNYPPFGISITPPPRSHPLLAPHTNTIILPILIPHCLSSPRAHRLELGVVLRVIRVMPSCTTTLLGTATSISTTA